MVPNSILNSSQYNHNQKMFESVSFLNSYLPEHFNSRFSELISQSQKFDPNLTVLVGDFVRMSKKLFTSVNNGYKLSDFLFHCFLSDSQDIYPESRSVEKICDQGKFLQSSFGKVNYLGIKIMLLFLYGISLLSQSDKLFNQNDYTKIIANIEKLLISSMQKLRFQLEMNIFVFGETDQSFTQSVFDKFVENVVSYILKYWEISVEVSKFIERVLSDDLSNISDKNRQNLLEQLLEKAQKRLMKNSTLQIKKNQGNIKNQVQLTKRKVIKQASPKANHQLTKSKPLSNLSNITKPAQFQKIPQGEMTMIARHKPIMKTRTIHQSRKNVFIPKNNLNLDFFGSSMCQKFQYSTQNSFDFTQNAMAGTSSKDTRMMDQYYQDIDDQSMLVRSTPKPMKLMTKFQIINKKIDFGL